MHYEELHAHGLLGDEDPQTLVIEASVVKSVIQCLVDTGASCSFISRDFYDYLYQQKLCSSAELVQLPIKLGDSSTAQSNGSLSLVIKINKNIIKEKFLILDKLPYQMILGFVCCKRNNMVIDTSQQTVFFKRTNTSQTNLYDDHLDVHLFSITHGATIPAFSQIIIDVSTKTSTSVK
jgi:hypothetical protein